MPPFLPTVPVPGSTQTIVVEPGSQAFQTATGALGQTQGAQKTEGPAGAGNLTPEAANAVPDPADQTRSVAIYAVVMDSIGHFISRVTDRFQVELASAVDKLSKMQSKNAVDKIKADSEAQRAEMEEQKAKFEEAADKIKKASHKHHGALGWIKAAFQALAATIAIGVGALLIATGVGAPLGALMIAAGVMGMVMAVDSMVKEGTGNAGIMGSIVLAAGGSAAQAQKADMGFGIALAVMSIQTSIAMFLVPGGQAMAVENMMMAAQTMQRMMTVAQNIATVTNAVAAAGGGAATIAEGTLNYQAATLQADAMDLKADAKTIQAIISQLDDAITQMLFQMQQSATCFADALDGISEAMRDAAKSAARKFIG